MIRFQTLVITATASLSVFGCAHSTGAIDIRELSVSQDVYRGQQLQVIGSLCVDESVFLLSSDQSCAASGTLSEDHVYLEMKMHSSGGKDKSLHGADVVVQGRFISPPEGAIIFTSGLLLGSLLEVVQIESARDR